MNKQLRKSLFPGGDEVCAELHWLHGGHVQSILDRKSSCFVLIKSSVGRCACGVPIILILDKFLAQVKDCHASCSLPASVLT